GAGCGVVHPVVECIVIGKSPWVWGRWRAGRTGWRGCCPQNLTKMLCPVKPDSFAQAIRRTGSCRSSLPPA
ncbi:MAG: hypothetical protein ACK4OP_18135, partial [Gemmobacter sp.]